MDASLESRFDRFWNEWEVQKQKMVAEVQSSVIEPIVAQIMSIEEQMVVEEEEKGKKMAADIQIIQAMLNELEQSFSKWQSDITALTEEIQKGSAEISALGQKTSQMLQKGREAIEKEQSQAQAELEAEIARILNNASDSITAIYEAEVAPNA